MIRYVLTITIFINFSLISFAQKSIKEKFYSRYVNDTVSYTAWLPENWSAKQNYTTIYTFSYGASDAEFTSEQIHYLNKLHISHLPPTIVVNISADMDRMGYNYETGLLTANGMNMVECMRKELIPLMESKYKASTFRTYMGQSYGASYGNYLFLFQPDIFSGYILMSPERLSALQPPFELTPELIHFYIGRPTYYFLATGALDMQRRQDYAKEISKKIKGLDSTKFNFRYENLSNAGHNNSLAIGLPLALSFIYQQYNSYPEIDSATSILSAIKQYEKNVNDIYRILPQKNLLDIYQPFLSYIWQRKDTTGMIDAINYFITKESSGRQLRDFAYSCVIVGLREKARQLYERAIKKNLADEMSTDLGPAALVTCYRELALNILKDDPQQRWNLLQKALKFCLQYKSSIYIGYYPDIYFYLGKFAADNDFNVRDGLHYLLLYSEKRKDLINLHFSFDEVYYNIGKCYALLHDTTNAKEYLQKALDLNSNNKKAKELLQKL